MSEKYDDEQRQVWLSSSWTIHFREEAAKKLRHAHEVLMSTCRQSTDPGVREAMQRHADLERTLKLLTEAK